jgi:hypothetical protein
MFEASGFFKSVSCSPSKNRVQLDNGISYIPDIVTQGKFKSFYEYERGYHNQTNFNAKLNKMCKVTNFVNIVTSNKENMDLVIQKVEKWVDSKGGVEAIAGKTVRVATALFLKDKNPEAHNNWNWVWNMRNEEPTINNGKDS